MDYDMALRLVLTWEHETEYAPWKAFIRNMEHLKKGLLAEVIEEERDEDIYTVCQILQLLFYSNSNFNYLSSIGKLKI